MLTCCYYIYYKKICFTDFFRKGSGCGFSSRVRFTGALCVMMLSFKCCSFSLSLTSKQRHAKCPRSLTLVNLSGFTTDLDFASLKKLFLCPLPATSPLSLYLSIATLLPYSEQLISGSGLGSLEPFSTMFSGYWNHMSSVQ